MDPIPITKIKMNRNKWLSTKIKYDDELLYNDIISEISNTVHQWILETDDLILREEHLVLHQKIIDLYLPFVEK